MTLVRTVAVCCICAWSALAQGVVEGLVRSQDGRPLPSVEVSLIGAESAVRPRAARTGSDGRFSFRGLPYGEYTLSFSKGGYEAGDRVAASAVVDGAEPTAELEVELRKSAVIAGRVTDRDGDPVADASVVVQVRQTMRGRTGLRPVQSATTDDRGEFRIHGLGPEKYLLRATAFTLRGVAGLMAHELESVYYPGAPRAAEAGVLRLDWGSEIEGIEIELGPSPATSLEGYAVAADGSACGSCQVHLHTPAMSLEASVTARKDGWFAIRGVQPGEYRASATSRRATQAAFEQVFVAEDRPTEVLLNLGEAVSVSGRVMLDGPSADVASEVGIRLLPVGGMGPRNAQGKADVASGGEFRIENLPPGEYDIVVGGADRRAYVKSLARSGRPLPSAGLTIPPGTGVSDLEIRLGTDAGVVEGSVEAPGLGRPDEAAPPGLVALIPDEYGNGFAFELLGDYRTRDGRFRIPTVPPGRYVILTVAKNNRYDLGDPEDLAYLREQGKKIRVAPRETLTTEAPFVPNR